LLFIFGAIWGLIGCFIISLIIAYIVRNFITNKKLAAPAGGYVIISGCSSGIGLDAVQRLSSIGFRVFAGVRKESDGEKVRSSCSRPEAIFPLILDVTNDDNIKQAVQTVRQQLQKDGGHLVGLINNAGYPQSGPLELHTRQEIHKQFDVNVYGGVELTRSFLPLLRETVAPGFDSRIVFVSSCYGQVTTPYAGLYSASKHAVEAIGDAFRMELCKWNIRVVILEPGAIRSNFMNVALANMNPVVLDADQLKQNNPNCEDQVLSHYKREAEEWSRASHKVPLSQTSVTSDAFEAAMTDLYPLPRYFPGKEAAFLPFLCKVPTELYDWLMINTPKLLGFL